MLQGVLADRFALRLHTEMRTLPVYALRVAKGGSKLQPASANVKCDPPGARGLAESTGEFDMTRLAARRFANNTNFIVDVRMQS
jgi:uncharacterized protein (TIGR03435 family)